MDLDAADRIASVIAQLAGPQGLWVPAIAARGDALQLHRPRTLCILVCPIIWPVPPLGKVGQDGRVGG